MKVREPRSLNVGICRFSWCERGGSTVQASSWTWLWWWTGPQFLRWIPPQYATPRWESGFSRESMHISRGMWGQGWLFQIWFKALASEGGASDNNGTKKSNLISDTIPKWIIEHRKLFKCKIVSWPQNIYVIAFPLERHSASWLLSYSTNMHE